MTIQAVMFDVIGTTVMENPGTVQQCFLSAFSKNQIDIDPAFIQANRGKEKKEVIDRFIREKNLPFEIGATIYQSFADEIKTNVAQFFPVPGAVDLFDFLREKHISVCLGTGLSRELFELILHHIKWNPASFAYTGTSSEIKVGRPNPSMIVDMMNKLSVTNPKRVIKIGDTSADIHEGRNAGVITAALLSGTQGNDVLAREKPDILLDTLSDLKRFTFG